MLVFQYRNKRQVTGSLGLDFTAEQLRANEDLKVIQNDTRILTMEAQILQQVGGLNRALLNKTIAIGNRQLSIVVHGVSNGMVVHNKDLS